MHFNFTFGVFRNLILSQNIDIHPHLKSVTISEKEIDDIVKIQGFQHNSSSKCSCNKTKSI